MSASQAPDPAALPARVTARVTAPGDGIEGGTFLGADTPLGPVYLALGQGDGGRSAAYLYFGKLF